MHQLLLSSLEHDQAPSVGAVAAARAAVVAEMKMAPTTAASADDSTQRQLKTWEDYNAWRAAMATVAREYHGCNVAQLSTRDGATPSHKRSRTDMEANDSTLAASSSSAVSAEFTFGGLMDLSLYNTHANVEEETHAILVTRFQRVQVDMLEAINAVDNIQALRQLDKQDFRQRQQDMKARLSVSKAKVAHLRRALRAPGTSLCATLED